MTGNNYMTQNQLAERWQVAESTLERWRSEGVEPGLHEYFGSRALSPARYHGLRRGFPSREFVSARNSTQQSVVIRSDPQDTREALLAAANT
jgi:hypothetical protein